MSFESSNHPRGQADNPGQFRDKSNSGPEAALLSAATDRTPKQIASDVVQNAYDEHGYNASYILETALNLRDNEAGREVLGLIETAAREAQTDRPLPTNSGRYETAREALAAHDNPAIEVIGADGFPLIGAVGRSEWVIGRLRTLIEPSETVEAPEQTAPAFKPEDEPDYYRSQWNTLERNQATDLSDGEGGLYPWGKLSITAGTVQGHTKWLDITSSQARRILEILSSEAE